MDTQQIIIEPNKRPAALLRELWDYRELFYFLAWRDILVRYKQTAIGIAWSVVRPVITMLVFTIVFGKIAKLPSGDMPYAVLVFAALLPWQFFSNTVSDSSSSLIANSSLVSKVYFPRIIIPTTAIVVASVDFAIACIILLLLMGWYGLVPGWQILIVPLLLLLVAVMALGIGYFVAAMNVKYRDFRYIIPFLMQLGLYISPVGFSSDIVPDKWRMLYSLNPMVGVIDGFRWVLLGGEADIYWPGFLLSITLGISVFFFGIYFFLRTERSFADVV